MILTLMTGTRAYSPKGRRKAIRSEAKRPSSLSHRATQPEFFKRFSRTVRTTKREQKTERRRRELSEGEKETVSGRRAFTPTNYASRRCYAHSESVRTLRVLCSAGKRTDSKVYSSLLLCPV